MSEMKEKLSLEQLKEKKRKQKQMLSKLKVGKTAIVKDRFDKPRNVVFTGKCGYDKNSFNFYDIESDNEFNVNIDRIESIGKSIGKTRVDSKDLLVSFEFEFDHSGSGCFFDSKSENDKFPKIAGKYGVLTSYEDGSVNSEWVSDPIKVCDTEALRTYIRTYCKYVDYLNNGERQSNASIHTTFSLGEKRDISFSDRFLLVGEIIRRYYAGFIWLSTPYNYTRQTYFRTYPRDVLTKNNYPAVIIPGNIIQSHVTNDSLMPLHKIEFRLPDTFYKCPEYGLFLVDLYKGIILRPSVFLNPDKKPADEIQGMKYVNSNLELNYDRYRRDRDDIESPVNDNDEWFKFTKLDMMTKKSMMEQSKSIFRAVINNKDLFEKSTVKICEALMSYKVGRDKDKMVTFYRNNDAHFVEVGNESNRYFYDTNWNSESVVPDNKLIEICNEQNNKIDKEAYEKMLSIQWEDDEEDLIECERCGNDVCVDEVVTYDGHDYCSDRCMRIDQELRYCEHCGEDRDMHSFHEITDTFGMEGEVCEDCFNSYYTQCPVCGIFVDNRFISIVNDITSCSDCHHNAGRIGPNGMPVIRPQIVFPTNPQPLSSTTTTSTETPTTQTSTMTETPETIFRRLYSA